MIDDLVVSDKPNARESGTDGFLGTNANWVVLMRTYR